MAEPNKIKRLTDNELTDLKLFGADVNLALPMTSDDVIAVACTELRDWRAMFPEGVDEMRKQMDEIDGIKGVVDRVFDTPKGKK